MSRLSTILACGALTCAVAAGAARAQDNRLQPSEIPLPNGQYVQAHVASFADLRFKGIVRQSMDLSCGAAALATLLHGYFNLDVDEKSIIQSILTSASPDDAKKIAEAGFSMLELKHYAEGQGLVAGGFRSAKATDLRKLRAPAIALINSRGYKHFVVIRHARGDEVAIADPVFGNRTESLESFARRWDNVILVAVAPGRPVNANFLEAQRGAQDPRAVQLFLTRYWSPAMSYGPGDFF
jgi:predicted double-glycine peptidase